VAYDRPPPPGEGAVALVADLAHQELLSVRYTTEALLGPRDVEAGAQAAAERQAAGIIAGANTVGFRLLGAQLQQREGDITLELEYVHEVCRGRLEEAAGGGKQCLGPRDDVLETPIRHHLVSITSGPGGTWTANAFLPEKAWPARRDVYQAVMASFRVAG